MARSGTQPYVGLAPFTADDSDFFFGRDRERRLIEAMVRVSRLTLLYGPSGVGKSSLLRAGVKRDLEEHDEEADPTAPDPPDAVVVVFEEWFREDPADGLRAALAGAVGECLGLAPPPDLPDRNLPDVIERWEAHLREEVPRPKDTPPPQLVFVLDQFEDYFRYHDREGGDRTIAEEFPRAVRDERLEASFLVSIREDAYASLDRFEAAIPQLYSNFLRIDYLDREAAEEAIRRPVTRYNEAARGRSVELDPELVGAVLEGVARADDPGLRPAGLASEQTPTGREARFDPAYLQLVMRRLWEEAARTRPRRLGRETYEALGGARRIVAAHLDETMATLGKKQQNYAATMFDRLVTPGGTRVAYSLGDLARYAARDPESAKEPSERKVAATRKAVEPILDRLAERRVLRAFEPGPGGKDRIYQAFHDLLAASMLDWRRRHEAEREKDVEKRTKTDVPDRVSFEELAKAQFAFQLDRRDRGTARVEVEARYRTLLAVFESAEGTITTAYWARAHPGGVAVTERLPERTVRLLGAEPEYRFHRYTSRLEDDPQTAALLSRCEAIVFDARNLPADEARSVLEATAAAAGRLLNPTVHEQKGRGRELLLLTQERALDRIEGRSTVAADEVARVSSGWGQALIGLFMMAFGVAVIYSLVALWPAVQATASAAGGSQTVHWLGSAYTPDRGTALLILVVLAGALGSYLHGIVSFADYVGNRRLSRAGSGGTCSACSLAARSPFSSTSRSSAGCSRALPPTR